jgi:hypothetical protein
MYRTWDHLRTSTSLTWTRFGVSNLHPLQLRTSSCPTWTLLGVSTHHLPHRTWPLPTRISSYLANYPVLQLRHLRLHLHAVRPPLYLLLRLLAVARAASMERSCVSLAVPLPPPLTWRRRWVVAGLGRVAAPLAR